LTTMVLFAESPKTDRVCAAGENTALTDGKIRSARGSSSGAKRPQVGFRRTGRDFFFFSKRFNQERDMRGSLQEGNTEAGAPTWGRGNRRAGGPPRAAEAHAGRARPPGRRVVGRGGQWGG